MTRFWGRPGTGSDEELDEMIRKARRLDTGSLVSRLRFAPAASIGSVLLIGALLVGVEARRESSDALQLVAGVMTLAWLLFTAWWLWSAWRFHVLTGSYFVRAAGIGSAGSFKPGVAKAESRRREMDVSPDWLPPSVMRSQSTPWTGRANATRSAPQPASDWRDFERHVARWLNSLDSYVVQGRGSRDGGVDVESLRFVVQVKDWSSRVGAPTVREIAGVAHARGKLAIVVARSGYTVDARRFADQAGVALFGTQGGTLVPVNSHARLMR